MPPRRRGLRNASQLVCTSSAIICKRLLGEAVEPTRLCVPLDVPVETSSFVFREPRTKLRKLVRRQSGYGLLYFFDRVHTANDSTATFHSPFAFAAIHPLRTAFVGRTPPFQWTVIFAAASPAAPRRSAPVL
jgi:hypothetical protein